MRRTREQIHWWSRKSFHSLVTRDSLGFTRRVLQPVKITESRRRARGAQTSSTRSAERVMEAEDGSCPSSRRERSKQEGSSSSLFSGLKEHAKEFMEATPEQHKK